jgi:putative nucleotidyltransferase-like protein
VANFEDLVETLRKAALLLQEADVPFVLGGGLACWARGGPETEHDLDIMVKPDDAERALQAFAAAGLRTEKPPEQWLYKAWDGDVMIDIIFSPKGGPIDDAIFERADVMEVAAVGMRVMALEDVMVTKLLALGEHELDYESVLEITRSLREQIDWDDVRSRTAESPYARAFFCLVEELDLLEPSGTAPATS